MWFLGGMCQRECFCASPTADILHSPKDIACIPLPFLRLYPPPPHARTGSSLKGAQRSRCLLGLKLWPHRLLSPIASSSSPRSHLYLHSSIMGFSFIRGSSQPGAVSLQSCVRAEHPMLASFAADHGVVKLGHKPWPSWH